ncbi:MAG: methyltransferase domain-containing protein [Candidatus Woesearchaeota archaeon]
MIDSDFIPTRAKYFLDLLLKYVDPNVPKPSDNPITILSIGCGYSGETYAFLSYYGDVPLGENNPNVKLYGVDINSDNIATCKEKYQISNCNFIDSDASKLLPNKMFDVVAFIHPQPSYWSDLGVIVDNAFSCLKPNGTAMVVTLFEDEINYFRNLMGELDIVYEDGVDIPNNNGLVYSYLLLAKKVMP